MTKLENAKLNKSLSVISHSFNLTIDVEIKILLRKKKIIIKIGSDLEEMQANQLLQFVGMAKFLEKLY